MYRGPSAPTGSPTRAVVALWGGILVAAPSSAQAALDLQDRVDRLEPGQTLVLEAGVHRGPVVVRTPLVTLEGRRGSIVDGGGRNTVITVEAPGVVLRGFTVRGSGRSTMNVDAGVRIQAQSDVTLEDLRLEEVAFGIDVAESRNVEVEGCIIRPRPAEVTARGDAIRIYSSEDVVVRRTDWQDSRDAVAWYSERVRFEENRGVRSRYSLHLMYSEDVMIRRNRFEDNSVGIFIMYGRGVTVLGKEVRRSRGAAGIGIGLKETSLVYAEGNAILSCATGIVIDNSPWGPGTRNWFHQNLIASNGRGILLANDRPGNQLMDNVVRSNTVSVDSEDRKTSRSIWRENFWDDYEGFDLDDDGFGDTPHAPKKFGDLLVGRHPSAQFFVGSPVLALVRLVERLVPVTEPLVLLEDPKPRSREPDVHFGLEAEER